MKPINLNKESCNPISSNCVIWQGPDIACIKLCKGDTVSDVVAKLATELCAVLDTLDVQNYDISCFNITSCGPQNFQQLIQFLIDQICALQNVAPDAPQKSGCPDCLVTVATCFSTEFPTGVAQLTDYVSAIAARICTIVLQVAALQNSIVDLDSRVTVLEGYFPLPAPEEPEIIPNCVLPSVLTPASVVLSALELQFCQLVSATGSASEIIAAYLSQCVAGSDPRVNGGGNMNTLPGWVDTVTNLAESITNIWLTICDIRDGLSGVSITPVDTQTIDLTVTGGPAFTLQADIVDTGWVDLNGFDYYTGSFANSKPQCRRIGNVIHFRGPVVVPLSNDGGPTVIPLASNASYVSQWFKAPWTGSGDPTYGNGVIISGIGSLTFNYNGVTATNVIPNSVWSGSLDNAYGNNWFVATRQLHTTIGAVGTALTSAVRISISSAGLLSLITLRDLEEISGIGGWLKASPLRFSTSYVRSGEYIPDFVNAATNIHTSPNPASSTTTTLPAPLAPDTQYINNINLDYPNTDVWPFDLDAALETDLGGFVFTLDGLMAYIAP
jgi:hypothetical protein